jgi:HSP20 family protein
MALTRWKPLGLEQLDRWRRWLDIDADAEQWLRVEEVRETGAPVVRAELPGGDPDKDVDVSVSDEVFPISAKREERTEHKDKGSYRSEFRYGEFSRNLALPGDVDQDTVKASGKDGVLEVRVPWTEEPESNSTKVPISRSHACRARLRGRERHRSTFRPPRQVDAGGPIRSGINRRAQLKKEQGQGVAMNVFDMQNTRRIVHGTPAGLTP